MEETAFNTCFEDLPLPSCRHSFPAAYPPSSLFLGRPQPGSGLPVTSVTPLAATSVSFFNRGVEARVSFRLEGVADMFCTILAAFYKILPRFARILYFLSRFPKNFFSLTVYFDSMLACYLTCN